MKNFTRLAVILIILLSFQFANGQNADFKGFELTGKNPEVVQLNQTFTLRTDVGRLPQTRSHTAVDRRKAQTFKISAMGRFHQFLSLKISTSTRPR